MQQKTIACIAIVLILLGGCNTKKESRAPLSKSDTLSMAFNRSLSSSAAEVNANDTTHRFIRTADLKFKVKNVVHATYTIEDIVAQQQGFVTYTNLSSEVNQVTSTRLNADSTLITTSFTVSNTMVLRVPNTQLDTTLKRIARTIDFLDYRVIKAEDVALQMLSNTLNQRRAGKMEKRLTDAIDERGKKLQETTRAEELLDQKLEQADQARIANLGLQDKILYSTVNLQIYQSPDQHREIIKNDPKPKEYEPSFGERIGDSLKSGWHALENLLVFLARLWVFLLIGITIYVAYLKWRK
jgi:PBP1b-binding outer membrane lipoprotein LpoB